MSILSRAKNALINLFEGKPANTNVIVNPTSPTANAVNAAAAVILPAAAAIPGASAAALPIEAVSTIVNDAEHPAAAATADVASALGAEAKTVANNFVQPKIGTMGTQMGDAAAEALMVAGAQALSSSSNKTEQEIASAVHDFLEGFEGTTQEPAAQAD